MLTARLVVLAIAVGAVGIAGRPASASHARLFTLADLAAPAHRASLTKLTLHQAGGCDRVREITANRFDAECALSSLIDRKD